MRAPARFHHLLIALLLVVAAVPVAAAQDVVFIVRHAERADGGRPAGMSKGPADPDLSEAGHARATRLAAMLKEADVRHIYVTQFKRTQQTAAPLAAAAHVDPTVVSSKEIDALVRQVQAADGPSLVVGHSDSVPEILKALGVTEDVHIGENDYDNFFIVVRGEGVKPVLLTLKF